MALTAWKADASIERGPIWFQGVEEGRRDGRGEWEKGPRGEASPRETEDGGVGRSQSGEGGREGGQRSGARDPADAAGPGSPKPRPEGRGRRRKSEGARAQWRGEERGTWQRARRLRASREPGWWRVASARAPWGKNPGPGKGGGAVLRGTGGGSRRVRG